MDSVKKLKLNEKDLKSTMNPKGYESVLTKFLARDFSLKSIGMTADHIKQEIARLRQCCCENDYYRISRVGSTLQLSRKGRAHIWNLRENAIKHAGFEDEMRRMRREEYTQ